MHDLIMQMVAGAEPVADPLVNMSARELGMWLAAIGSVIVALYGFFGWLRAQDKRIDSKQDSDKCTACKAHLEAELQLLKDKLRDATIELSNKSVSKDEFAEWRIELSDLKTTVDKMSVVVQKFEADLGEIKGDLKKILARSSRVD